MNIQFYIPETIYIQLHIISDESYDRLDFNRPDQDLLPHYLSTETIRSQRSRNSSDPNKDDKGAISESSFEFNIVRQIYVSQF